MIDVAGTLMAETTTEARAEARGALGRAIADL